MNYPVWDVPILGSGLVIALIAVFHVMISHFAVGGGLYLPMAEYRALKTGRREWFDFLPKHSQFFLILTGVFGAVSGVGIWFSIGLAAPEATSTLIHNFVFGWAIEWVFFLVELSTAAVYYYTWGRIPAQLHLKVGWLYAVTSLFTLFIINGILTFMLTPGDAWLAVAGTGQEPMHFLEAFFNPTYWPGVALRILVCISLAGIWALITGSRINGYTHPELKKDVIRWSFRWLLPGFFLMPFCFLWYVWNVPASQRELAQLGISTIGAGTFTQVTRTLLISVMASATILAVTYLAAYRNPREFRLGYACAILLLGLAATGASEQAREMLRKPFVVCGYMYSNAVRKLPVQVDGQRVSEVERFNTNGYLAETIWVTADQRAAWALQDRPAGGIPARLVAATATDPPAIAATPETVARGELVFRGQCVACHTIDGYRSMRRLVHERNAKSIANILTMLHERKADSPYRAFMPPLVGTQAEIDALGAYLTELIPVPAE